MKAYQVDIIDVASKLSVDIKRGLDTTEALERLKQYGPNSLPKKRSSLAIYVFLSQFLNPLMLILLIAALASIVIGKPGDTIVICLAAIINAIVGFIQEWKAEQAAEALRLFDILKCEVLRDGIKVEISTTELTVGDIVFLSAGTKIPADIRLTKVVNFFVDQALLTGELNPVKKFTEPLDKTVVLGDQNNMAFNGTFAISGRAEGIVVAVGMSSELGGIVKLVLHTEDEITPMQMQLKNLSWFLGFIMISISVYICIVGLLFGFSFIEIISISVALAVASIPEGLLVSMTVILAVGMQRMFKRKALVKKLIAAETLGSVSVVCTDKTGTLTEGYLSVDRIITIHNNVELHEHLPDEVYDALIMVALNNDASIDNGQRIGDSSELALLEAAIEANINVHEKKISFPRIKEIPFSSDLKYMATVTKGKSERLIVKGAPDVVFGMCYMSEEQRERFGHFFDEFTNQGFRVLAVAFKDKDVIDIDKDLSDLNIVALFVMSDSLRPDAYKTIEELKTAGIKTVLVTGDYANTASTVARGVGLVVDGLVTGEQIEEMSDSELQSKIVSTNVFARVDPKHKLRIIKAWQALGKSVAMIGDGVNDAPAIRGADIGIGLVTGSDLVKEIADIVLLDNNLSTIEAAVKEGRIIFDNIRKVIVYLLIDSFSEIVLIIGSILLGLPLPITALQILWINLISDGFPSLALSMDPGEPHIMRDLPRLKNERIVNKDMKIMIILIGFITDLGLFGLYYFMFKYNIEPLYLRTIIFTALSIDSLLYVFSVRSMRSSIFRINPFGNRWLVFAVLLGLLTQLLVIYIPYLQKLFSTVYLGIEEWIIILTFAVVKITIIEIIKEWFLVKKESAL